MSVLTNRTVLITGGTGSFGKAFVKRILSPQHTPGIALDSGPKKVIVFSRDELKQYEMAQEITDDRLRFFLGDVRDRDRLYRAFDGVDIVVHAAALKQVPAAEYNPIEFIKTNIMGSANVIDAAIDREVEQVIALSTDKACSPVNLYGATKLCADKLFLAGGSYSGSHRTKFAVVRYGNVAGSRGSVIPLFLKNRGGVVGVTDPNMTRFHITLSKAAGLVLTGLRDMKGGEIFVPKLPSVRIVDIAEALGCSYEIVGIRPGEKLHETLISEDEARSTYDFGDHYVVSSKGTYGMKVPEGFRYSSDTNPHFLNVWEIRESIDTLTL